MSRAFHPITIRSIHRLGSDFFLPEICVFPTQHVHLTATRMEPYTPSTTWNMFEIYQNLDVSNYYLVSRCTEVKKFSNIFRQAEEVLLIFVILHFCISEQRPRNRRKNGSISTCLEAIEKIKDYVFVTRNFRHVMLTLCLLKVDFSVFRFPMRLKYVDFISMVYESSEHESILFHEIFKTWDEVSHGVKNWMTNPTLISMFLCYLDWIDIHI
jgi:hypothetical protein